MKIREYRYRLFSHILWGKKKAHYKLKWQEIKFNKKNGQSISELIKKLRKSSKKQNKPVVIYVSYFDYYSPLQQRPNHMFNILADKGYPCLFCCGDSNYTNPRKNMHVIPSSWLKYVLNGKFPKVFDVPYGYPYLDMPNFFQYINDKSLVIYELIDDFDLLQNPKIIHMAKSMFCELVKRKNTFVLASADKLHKIALELGCDSKKIIVSKNAVNIQDFIYSKEQQLADIMQKIVNKNKPIVGYYGALTISWFDFELISEVIKNNQDMEFVFIGLKYPDIKIKETEACMNNLGKYSNFTYIPPISYKEIPNYAHCWDVAIIPFKINDITLGTSPVKLFEYMAMGLPIVTTPMPECKLYKSVYISNNAEEFGNQLKKAIASKKDPEYQSILRKEASENTWEMRVEDMIKIIKDNYKEN